MRVIDLRSDTVTHPTPRMRDAMQRAEVGDDVYGEDPTINRLEAVAAAMLGKEAGMFVPSGTMGNLSAILAHCGRGDEVLLGDLSHTYLFEAGGISALGGVHSFALPNQPDGTLLLDEVQRAIRPDDPHFPRTRLVVLENTHNRCGGAAISVDFTRRIADLAHERGLQIHLDGARIFNAAAAQGVPAAELVLPVDSVTFCLSKALCAPVGSVVCGTRTFIARARRMRKQLGGGMRQAGILAAAGIVALEEMIDRLVEDHERAQRLAEGMKGISGLRLVFGTPETNMVFCELDDEPGLEASWVASKLSEEGVRVSVVGPRRFRLVTHYWIDDSAVDRAVSEMRKVLEDPHIQTISKRMRTG